MSTGAHDDDGADVVPAQSPTDALLFQLALRGALDSAALVAAVDASEATVRDVLARLAEQQLVLREERGGRAQLTITVAGRDRAAVAIATESAALKPRVAPIDAEFAALNRRVKQILYRWQVRVDRTTEALNDHSDARYDAAVLADLRSEHQAADRLLARLEPLRWRYASLRRRLATALARALAGERAAVAGVTSDSFHAAWWELHADLLAVLGRARSADDA